MKIVAVLGSPHKMAGTTGQMLESLLAAAKAAGAETSLFVLTDLDVAPCIGCDACHRTGECSIDDDFADVLEAMVEADAIVIASPNYIWSVSAQMKALIDRCCGPLHIMALDGKHGAAVVTSGGPGAEEVEDYILRYVRGLGCWAVGSVSAIAAELEDESRRPEALAKAADLGAKLVAAVKNNTTYPEQVEEKRGRRQRMKQLVMSRADRWAYEADVWRSRPEG